MGFDDLMGRMDAARAASLTPPERFFKKAQAKIAFMRQLLVIRPLESCDKR